jgi:hypothetical protein
MENITSGAGLAALGFWIFIAAAVAASYWDTIRKRESQHETLRRVIESGQTIDDELIDKLLSLTGGSQDLARDLKIGGVIMMFIAPGLALMGWVLAVALDQPELVKILLGVAGLVAFIAVGLLAAAAIAKRQDSTNPSGQIP